MQSTCTGPQPDINSHQDKIREKLSLEPPLFISL